MEEYNAKAIEYARQTRRVVITSMLNQDGSGVDLEHRGAAKTWAQLGIPLVFYRTAVGADIYPKMEALQEIGVTHLILEDHESSASFYIPALNNNLLLVLCLLWIHGTIRRSMACNASRESAVRRIGHCRTISAQVFSSTPTSRPLITGPTLVSI